MTLLQALVLGIVQGVTEYLPVSSSAHLVLVPKIMGWHFSEQEAFLFDVLVQLGTLVGVVAYFFSDIVKVAQHMISALIKNRPFQDEDSRYGWFIVVATIPAGVIGLVFKKEISAFFSSPKAALAFLLVTAFLLIVAELLRRATRIKVTLRDSVLIGFAQAFALFPGLSRSGSTIAIGMMAGLKRETAAKFSFLMSIPVMLGASIIAVKDIIEAGDAVAHMVAPILVGFVTSAISGYLVIKWFLVFLKNQSLLWFAGYCILVGGIGLFLHG